MTGSIQPTEEQRRAIITAYHSGLTARQTAEQFGVSIHTVFYTLRKYKVPRRSPAESNKILFETKQLSFSIKQDLSSDEEQLRQAAVMLYWAEGYKVGKSGIDFTNSDPDMVLLFKRFLSEVCSVDDRRLRCVLYCHEGQDVRKMTVFWSTLLSIPEYQFTKPYIKRGNTAKRSNCMQYGLVHLRYYDTKLLRQMLVWIDEYRARFCVGGGVVNRIGL